MGCFHVALDSGEVARWPMTMADRSTVSSREAAKEEERGEVGGGGGGKTCKYPVP